MPADPSFTLVVHAGPGVFAHLQLLPGGSPDLVVELGLHASLAHRFKLATPPDYPGLAGLAAPEATLEDLGTTLPGGPAVILAPGADCAPETMLEGLVRLRELVPAGRRVAVLWSVDENAWEPGEVAALCDQLVFLWNPDRPTPPAALERVKRLQAEGALTPAKWAGWIFQPSPTLSAEDEVALRRTFAAHPGVAVL